MCQYDNNNDGFLSLFLPRPSPFIFSPFSSGHRACIGKVFAMVSFKQLVAILNFCDVDLLNLIDHEESGELSLIKFDIRESPIIIVAVNFDDNLHT